MKTLAGEQLLETIIGTRLMIPLCLANALALLCSTVEAATPFVAAYDRFQGDLDGAVGAVLLTELGCAACHATDNEYLAAKAAPKLDGAGLRLKAAWMRSFLESPQQTKPGTTMPDMLAGWNADDKQAAITALLAFLGSQQVPIPDLDSTASNPIARQFWSKGDASSGKRLYHQVGCVACHDSDSDYQMTRSSQPEFDEETLADLGISSSALPVRSVPHPQLNQKYTEKSLTFFLLDPLAIRPAGRMPSLKLNPDEAADIAAYLLADQDLQIRRDSGTSVVDLIATGKRLFRELGCANCHDPGGVANATEAPRLVDLNTSAKPSCVDEPRKGLPDYSLDDSQRSALKQAIANATVDNPVQHRMMQLNCYACHQRDDLGGVGPERRQYFETAGHVDLGDEGRIPPPLDGVGRKLTDRWAAQVFAGKGDLRPFLAARMPVFGTTTDSLPKLLAAADSIAPNDEPFRDIVASGEAGRTLFDQGCVQCHPLQGERLAGVVGMDVAGVNGRLRAEWFRAFLLDPAGLKQRTRMPTFFRDGKSSSPDVLDGDVDRQIASLWVYLNKTKQHGMPDRILRDREHDFELVPKDRPIVLRTFMDRAGPHAIAVGFPQQVNLAFDAETVGVAQFWKGRFLDAHGTWFDRFTPPAKPLGSDVVDLPTAGAFALSSSGETPPFQFGGYRIDTQGVPTFLYRFAGCDVQDRFEPAEPNGFRRRLKLASSGNESKRFWFRALVGKKLKRVSDTEYQNDLGLSVSVEADAADEPYVKTAGNQSTWLIPVDVGPKSELVVRYQW